MFDDETYRALCEKLERKLRSCFTRGHDPEHCFARNGSTREILDSTRLTKLFHLLLSSGPDDKISTMSDERRHHLQRTVERIRGDPVTSKTGCCNILGTLLYSRCHNLTLQRFEQALHDDQKCDILDDENLPFEKPQCIRLFGESDGPRFWSDQFLFCAVRFKEGNQVSWVGSRASCRLPFVYEPEEIGRGTFGVVRRAVIEAGHLINKDNEAPLQMKAYAVKELKKYSCESLIKAEGDILQQIIQANKQHNNILTTRASLERKDSYFLVFDLADHDLEKYFHDPSIPAPRTSTQRMTLFASFIDLAGGLAYLHEELSFAYPERNQRFRCYHLDLKPSNILVFTDGEHLTLKFTDFGISRIKYIQHSALNDEGKLPDSLDKIFRSRYQAPEPTSGVDNPRPGGTFAAPETNARSNRVTTKSDVWSFGAVLTVAMTYMQFGQSGIEDFAAARAIGGRDDKFYAVSPIHTREESGASYVLDDSVLTQLHKMTRAAMSNDQYEGIAFELACTLIEDGILCSLAAQRLPAKRIEEGLRTIHSDYYLSRVSSLSMASQDGSLSIDHQSNIPTIVARTIQGPESAFLDRSRTWPLRPASAQRAEEVYSQPRRNTRRE